MFERKKSAGKIYALPIESIQPSPFQARTNFNEQELAGLAASIRENGLLQPIAVRKKEDGYELVAGERRLRAARLAGLSEVPCLLADVDEESSGMLALVENLQRRDLDYIEEAEGLQKLMQQYHLSQEQAARRIGKSQSAVANKLRILRHPPSVLQALRENHLTERHARAVLRLPESRRTAALEKMARDKMSVRQADKLVDQMLTAPNAPSPCRRTIPMVRDVRFFVNTLQHAVDLMTQKGIAATTHCDKHDGCLEYIVRIPVSSDGTVGKQEDAPKKEDSEFAVKV